MKQASLRSILNETYVKTLYGVNKIRIGKVIRVGENGTLDITPMEYDSEPASFNYYNTTYSIRQEPDLFGVPVLSSSVKSSFSVGEYVLLGIADFSYKKDFFNKGSTYKKDVAQIHTLGNAIVIGKMHNMQSPLLDDDGGAFTFDRTILQDKEAYIVIKDNKVAIKNSTIDIKTVIENITDMMATAVKDALATALYSTFPLTNAPAVDAIIDAQVTSIKSEVEKLFY